MRSTRVLAGIAIAVGAAVLVLGCASPPDTSEGRGFNVQRHAEVAAQMKRAMHEMYNVLYERHISELERDDERRRYAIKLSERVLLISEEIRKYPTQSGWEEFSHPKKTAAFLSLADRLKNHAEAIGKSASDYQFRMLGEEITNMVQTCNQCHAQFNPLAPKIE